MQRQQRIAAEQQTGGYDGDGYCAEGYSENASDQYDADMPSWVNDIADAHWQQSEYAAALLLLLTWALPRNFFSFIMFSVIITQNCDFYLFCTTLTKMS